MKKSINEDVQRIMKIMGISGKMKLNELNVRYMDELLDKISKSGMESLSDYEKQALQKLSNDEDVNPPEKHSLGTTSKTLRFTPLDAETGKPMVQPPDAKETFGQSLYADAYLDGEAQELAGYDQPIFIDGDLSQLDKPKEEQKIQMLLPQGEYECVAKAEDVGFYYINLKQEEDDDYNLMENFINQDAPSEPEHSPDFELGEIENYKI
jgi:hypothetical protein